MAAFTLMHVPVLLQYGLRNYGLFVRTSKARCKAYLLQISFKILR